MLSTPQSRIQELSWSFSACFFSHVKNALSGEDYLDNCWVKQYLKEEYNSRTTAEGNDGQLIQHLARSGVVGPHPFHSETEH